MTDPTYWPSPGSGERDERRPTGAMGVIREATHAAVCRPLTREPERSSRLAGTMGRTRSEYCDRKSLPVWE